MAPTARWQPWPLVLGVVAALTLVGSVAAAVVVSGSGSDSSVLGSIADEAPAEWDERVVDLVRFIEEERGLEFEHPVQIDFLTREEFSKELETGVDDLTEEDLEEFQETLPGMRALGLIAGELDVLDTLLEYTEAALLAFYDHEEKRIVVPTTEPTIVDEVTLVHELTHALQDQHFDLSNFFPDEDDDGDDGEGLDPSTTTLEALVEGDAKRIESAYLATLSRVELGDYIDLSNRELEEAEDVIADIPAVVVASTQAPYVLGEPFVNMIATDGGNRAVDRAFEDPPTTSKYLFDPRIYMEGETIAAVDVPALPEGVDESMDEGEFGALDVHFVLAERVEPFDALASADHWAGGSYVTYEEDGGRICQRIALGSATQDGADWLQTTFEQWASEAPPAADAAVLSGPDEELLVETCDPGPDAELAHDRAIEALDLASLRPSLAWELVTYQGRGTDEAWDIADCALEDLYGVVDFSVEWSDQESDLFRDTLAACEV